MISTALSSNSSSSVTIACYIPLRTTRASPLAPFVLTWRIIDGDADVQSCQSFLLVRHRTTRDSAVAGLFGKALTLSFLRFGANV